MKGGKGNLILGMIFGKRRLKSLKKRRRTSLLNSKGFSEKDVSNQRKERKE